MGVAVPLSRPAKIESTSNFGPVEMCPGNGVIDRSPPAEFAKLVPEAKLGTDWSDASL